MSTDVSEIPDQDWNAQWKASMRAALVAPGIWVSPVWLAPPLSQGDHWIKIEPKTAFGTGHHATTRLAARGLTSLRGKLFLGFSLLDIGTGTGVLCFVAERCGAGRTLGIDNDPVCAGNLAENRVNNPSPFAGGFVIGALETFKPRPSFDCVIMNMLQIESQPLLSGVFRLLKSPGYLIWSGILIEEKKNVILDASQKGFALYEETTEEEWWCGIFIKKYGIAYTRTLYSADSAAYFFFLLRLRPIVRDRGRRAAFPLESRFRRSCREIQKSKKPRGLSGHAA
jgi:ribosomal protein L11 methyltransferase